MDPPYRYFVARKAPVVRPVYQSTNRSFLTTLQESRISCSDALVRGSFEVEATENSFMSHRARLHRHFGGEAGTVELFGPML